MSADPTDVIDDDAARVVEEYGRRSIDPALARYYARIGPALDRAIQVRRSAILKIFGKAADVSTLRLLDLGCGDGADLAFFADHGFDRKHLTGVDLLPDAIARARTRLPEATFLESNAARLPFEDDAFDVVIQTTVLSSILNPDVRAAVAAEAARVVRRGGSIVSYDMRSGGRSRSPLVGINRAELLRLFGGVGEIEISSITLALTIASRIPHFLQAPLEHIGPLRSHYLAVIHKA